MLISLLCRTVFLVLLAVAPLATPFAIAQDLQRGLINYLEIISGKKNYNQLSPQEQQEDLLIYSQIQAQNQEGQSSECKNARDHARSHAEYLVRYARNLISCAESGNYKDDCDSEFRRVKREADDYQSAVDEVQSRCR
jgi:hypothetical protein